MNCYNHADATATAFCRDCGRALCLNCQRRDNGTVLCPEHAPANSSSEWSAGTGEPTAGANPYAGTGFVPPAQTVTVGSSPALAFALGFIPGVGAIYNGQYMKGLVHAVVFGAIVTLLSNNDGGNAAPLFGILLAAFVLYMPFEAYHTAKRRQAGLAVDEWSSFAPPPAAASTPSSGYPAGSGPVPVARRRTLVGPVVLIGLGVLFLLDTLNLIRMHDVLRYWPAALIAVGAYRLYAPGGSGVPPVPPPNQTWQEPSAKVPHE